MTERRNQRARNPNRWLAYGIMLGAMLGWAIDVIPVGLLVGVVVGIMLRGREIEEAAELAKEFSAHTPRPDDTVH